MILVGDRTHYRADVERLLAIRVGGSGEDVTDSGEVAAGQHVREPTDVTVDRVGGDR